MTYDIDYSQLWLALLPPVLRKPKMGAWGNVLLKPLQSLHDFIFGDYADGSNYQTWLTATNYVVGDKVIYTQRTVYICIQSHLSSGLNAPGNTAFWKLVTDNYIGIRERVKYNSQKILFEYALNRWFQCAGIYITNNNTDSLSFVMGNTGPLSSTLSNNSSNSSDYMGNSYIQPTTNTFTIFVPLAVFNALSPVPSQREALIRSFADVYVLAGMIYDVQTY